MPNKPEPKNVLCYDEKLQCVSPKTFTKAFCQFTWQLPCKFCSVIPYIGRKAVEICGNNHSSNAFLSPSLDFVPQIVSVMKPLLKWPGGKQRLTSEILQHMPGHYDRYYEPFCGGAALYFAMEPVQAVLCDVNETLIECYRSVADETHAVIETLRSFPNTKEDYLRIRSEQPTTPHHRAAQLIYLCRLSFNGIYRVNRKNQFNVPYSGRTTYKFCDEHLIQSAATLLRRTELKCLDFTEAVAEAQKGDLVYFDPPYATSDQQGFLEYNDKLFSWEDQQRVAATAERLRLQGCHVLVSNARHERIQELYPNFRQVDIQRHSGIAGGKLGRKFITEALFVPCPR